MSDYNFTQEDLDSLEKCVRQGFHIYEGHILNLIADVRTLQQEVKKAREEMYNSGWEAMKQESLRLVKVVGHDKDLTAFWIENTIPGPEQLMQARKGNTNV